MLDVLFHDEFPLEPESDAGHDLPVDNGLMILSCVVRRGTDATYPVHADVGRKLPADLVAQAQTNCTSETPLPIRRCGSFLPYRLISASGCRINRWVNNNSYSARRRAAVRPDVLG